MKKILIYVALIAIVLIVVVSGTLAGAWFWLFSSQGRGFLTDKINQTIPGALAFQDLSVSLLKREVLLKDVAVATPDGEKVLSFEKLFVGIDSLSLGKKEIGVTFELVAPDIALIQDETGAFSLVSCFVGEIGEKPPEEEKPPSTEPFSLPVNPIINSFVITRGHVVVEQQGLSVEVNDISFGAKGNYLAQAAEVNLSVKKVTADMEGQHLLINDIALLATLLKGDLSGLSFSLNTPFGELSLDGSVAKVLTTPEADLALHIEADGEKAASVMGQKELVSGMIEADVAVKGTMEDPAGHLRLLYKGGNVMGRRLKDVLVDFSLKDEKAILSRIHIDHGAGSILLTGEADLSKAFPDGFSGKTFLPDRITASLHAEGKDLVPGIALADEGIEDIHGALSFGVDANLIPERLPELVVSITGNDLGYRDHSRADVAFALSLENDRLELEQCTISASPEKALFSIDVTGKADLAEAFPNGLMAKNIFPEKINGILSIDGEDLSPGDLLAKEGIDGVHGTFDLHVDASVVDGASKASVLFSVDKAGYQEKYEADAEINLTLADNSVNVETFSLASHDSGIEIKGNAVVLDGLSPLPWQEMAVDLSLESDRILVADFYQADPGVNAAISFSGQINGRLDDPDASFELRADNIVAGEEEIRGIRLALTFQENRLKVAPLDIAFTSDHHLTATGWADMDRQFAVDVECPQLPLATVNAIRKTGLVSGNLALSLHADGSVENPVVDGVISLSELTVKDRPVRDIETTVMLENMVATVDADLGFGAKMDYDLNTRDFNAKIDFNDMALAGWLAVGGMEGFDGAVSGEITAGGNADAIDGIRANVAIDALTLVNQDRYKVSSQNITATLQGTVFELSPLTLTLPGEAQLTIQGRGDVEKTVYAEVAGEIPLATVAMFTDQLSGLTGDIGLDVTAAIQKDIAASDINVKIAFNDMGVIIPELEQKLHGVSGAVIATPDEILIQDLAGKLDEGTFSVSGRASLDAFQPRSVDVRFGCDALPVSVPDTLDVEFSSDISWKGDLEASLVQGTVTLVSGLFSQDVKLENIAFDSLTKSSRKAQAGGEKQAEGSSSGFLDTISLDITIKEGSAFVVSNNMAEMEIHPDITIGGKASNPSVIGRSTIDPGFVAYFGKEFEITNGIIDFTNPYQIEPEIDVKALSTVRDWEITMNATGTPKNLVVSLSSDPPEEDEDILSLLVAGKTTNELISSEGGETTSPSAILAGVVASNLADRLKQSTGLDLLEVETGADPTSDVNVTAGKELTENVTLKYGIETEDGKIVQTTTTEYKLMDSLTASGFQDTEGTFGGELRYRLEFE